MEQLGQWQRESFLFLLFFCLSSTLPPSLFPSHPIPLFEALIRSQSSLSSQEIFFLSLLCVTTQHNAKRSSLFSCLGVDNNFIDLHVRYAPKDQKKTCYQKEQIQVGNKTTITRSRAEWGTVVPKLVLEQVGSLSWPSHCRRWVGETTIFNKCLVVRCATKSIVYAIICDNQNNILSAVSNDAVFCCCFLFIWPN